MGSSEPKIFLMSVSSWQQTTKPILTKFAPNMYFGKIYVHVIRSLKCFKINPYFATKRPSLHLYRLTKNGSNDFDEIVDKKIGLWVYCEVFIHPISKKFTNYMVYIEKF